MKVSKTEQGKIEQLATHLQSQFPGLAREDALAQARAARKSARARERRKVREEVMRDMGLVKVRSESGRVYWE